MGSFSRSKPRSRSDIRHKTFHHPKRNMFSFSHRHGTFSLQVRYVRNVWKTKLIAGLKVERSCTWFVDVSMKYGCFRNRVIYDLAWADTDICILMSRSSYTVFPHRNSVCQRLKGLLLHFAVNSQAMKNSLPSQFLHDIILEVLGRVGPDRHDQ